MKRVPLVAAAAALGFLLGCVIIPDRLESRIVVDMGPIEEQADAILDYVEGKTDALPRREDTAPENSSLLDRAAGFIVPVSVAYAADSKESVPKVSQIADRMRARNGAIALLKKGGSIGENVRGLLEMVKPEAIADAEAKNAAQRLIAAENQDRKALYKEITRLNRGRNLHVSVVERVYALKRLTRGKPGDVHQLPPAGENFEKVKVSVLGQRLGSLCVPEAWVTLP